MLYSDAVDVLVVDDDAAILSALHDVLVDEGFLVGTAVNGAHALEVIRSGRPIGMVLTDLMMDHMSGWELIAVLREERPDLPVVAVSGCAASLWPKGTTTIAKPMRLDGLYALVRATLEERKCQPTAI